jgi:hypothetical protein
MSEEERSEVEEEKRKEEKRNVAKQLATSFPKFLINGLIVIGLGLFYFFAVPIFIALDGYPMFVINAFDFVSGSPVIVILTGYSLIQVGVLLVILLFGMEALLQLVKSADAFVDYIMSRLPGMRSIDRGHTRRIPLDIIYIFFTLVVYILISPIFQTGTFPVATLQGYFHFITVALVLFFVLTFLYDLAKSIQKSAKRGIDKFGKRLGRRFEEDEEAEPSDMEY